MRNLLTLLAAMMAVCITAAAQDQSRFEVFGGYSLERIAPCGSLTLSTSDTYPCNAETGFLAPTTNFNGWDASFTGYFNRVLGATADFSGHYGPYRFPGSSGSYPSASRYSYMFGPVFAWRSPKFTRLFTSYSEAPQKISRVPSETTMDSPSQLEAVWT